MSWLRLVQVQHSWRLPPLREVVLLLPLTVMQRRLYLWLLTRDSRLLVSSSRTVRSGVKDLGHWVLILSPNFKLQRHKQLRNRSDG